MRESGVGGIKGRLPHNGANTSSKFYSTQRPSLIEKEIQELRAREEELRYRLVGYTERRVYEIIV